MNNVNKIFLRLLNEKKIRAIDIGADGGLSELWVKYLPVLMVDAFEPNIDECNRQKLKSPAGISWHPFGLAKDTGDHVLYVPARTTGASLYRPNVCAQAKFGDDKYWGETRESIISCLSFKDFLFRNGSVAPDMIKLDTQGSEIDILSSLSSGDFEDILAIEIEVEFIEFYEKQPLFSDVHKFMELRGFELLDLRTARSYYSKNNKPNFYINKYLLSDGKTPSMGSCLVAGDAFYVKKFENIKDKKDRVIRSILIAIIYCFFDHAMYLSDLAKQQSVISDEEFEEIISIVRLTAPKTKLINRNNFYGKFWKNSLKKIGLIKDLKIGWMTREWPNS